MKPKSEIQNLWRIFDTEYRLSYLHQRSNVSARMLYWELTRILIWNLRQKYLIICAIFKNSIWSIFFKSIHSKIWFSDKKNSKGSFHLHSSWLNIYFGPFIESRVKFLKTLFPRIVCLFWWLEKNRLVIHIQPSCLDRSGVRESGKSNGFGLYRDIYLKSHEDEQINKLGS